MGAAAIPYRFRMTGTAPGIEIGPHLLDTDLPVALARVIITEDGKQLVTEAGNNIGTES